jgi:cellulose synthase/poly-beta-1,6-N-acetylglucosamine synthase-like glycosyltransferase
VTHLLTIALGVYMGTAVASYLALLLLSIYADRQYRKGQSYRDLLLWGIEHDAPAVTILAPAKNEEPIIQPSVAALLRVPYPNLSVVVIDDGSTDRTFDILREVYQLTETGKPVERLPHSPIESVWKSGNEPRLTVVRKQSVGSKGDANNAGLEVVLTPYVLVTDVDSTLEHDTIQKMVVRLVETKSVAVGCSLRPLNGCKLTKNGVKIEMPRNYWAFAQVAEYIRTFQFRQGWVQMGAVFNISGAAGLFLTSALFEIGGYRSDTPAEDLASTWSFHQMGMKIGYEPSTNIYTQVPDSAKALGSQRKRWSRGLVQNLLFPRAKQLLFTKTWGAVLMLWLWTFEAVEPFIEFAGLVWVAEKSWHHTLAPLTLNLLIAAVFLTPLLTIICLIQMERNYSRLSAKSMVAIAVFSFVEMFPLKLPVGLAWRIEGVFHYLAGVNSWEALPRQQFKQETSCAT